MRPGEQKMVHKLHTTHTCLWQSHAPLTHRQFCIHRGLTRTGSHLGPQRWLWTVIPVSTSTVIPKEKKENDYSFTAWDEFIMAGCASHWVDGVKFVVCSTILDFRHSLRQNVQIQGLSSQAGNVMLATGKQRACSHSCSVGYLDYSVVLADFQTVLQPEPFFLRPV